MNLGRKFEVSVSPNTKGAVIIVNNIDGSAAAQYLKPLQAVVKKYKTNLSHPVRCYFENLTEEQIKEMKNMMPKVNIYG